MVVVGGGLFDFRVTPNPNFRLDVNLDVEFDKIMKYAFSLNRYVLNPFKSVSNYQLHNCS